MAQDDDELQERVCRACNQTYKYPVFKSMATRFYCESCMELPAVVRATFEQFNKRVKTLSTAVQKLEQKLSAGERTLNAGEKASSGSPPLIKGGQGGVGGRASRPPSTTQEPQVSD